jgi:hypothetical protein
VTAEPYVRRRFEGRAPAVVTVNNFPMLEEFIESGDGWPERERAACYAGSITELRGAAEMVDAIAATDATLLLAGRFGSARLREELEAKPGWRQVEFLGHVDRAGLTRMLARARAGLVVLRPIPNYMEANPTKMYEYMSAGIPVIASDFPAWAAIVNEHGCGLCVDPTDPEAIAGAIRWLVDNPEEARRMGENGRRAAERRYNWSVERGTLLELYERLV